MPVFYLISKTLLVSGNFPCHEIAYRTGHILANEDPSPLLEIANEAFRIGEREAGEKLKRYINSSCPSPR